MFSNIKNLLLLLGITLASSGFCQTEYSMEYIGKRTKLFHKGIQVDFPQCVQEQMRRYPESCIQDFVNLAYQGAWGAAPVFRSRKEAWEEFKQDYAAAIPSNAPLFEVISPDFCRLNLGAWKNAALPEKWLFNMYCASAEILPESQKIFEEYLLELRSLLRSRRSELDEVIKKYNNSSPQHSQLCCRKCRPAYRLLNTRFLTVLPLLRAAAKLPVQKVSVIAVDGRAASGKTTLAGSLALILETKPVHMDDFFLPPDLRNPRRLSEPGGNIHYERFIKEVLPNLRQGKSFSYQKFDCSKMQLGAMRHIPASRWRIVEGANSLHPVFGNYADLRVFFDISPTKQISRIRKRNGERKALEFLKKWIPMEEKYISTFQIKKKAQIIIGSSR